ncbi:MAG TPA: alpha-hydroxy acid oxidase [Solirubrobacteraceae bacterium]|nr:alpha-hydroxy acid oxidase [Solirubrobacteraceae bacterium]
MGDRPARHGDALSFLARGVTRELRDRLSNRRAGRSTLRGVHNIADMQREAQRALPRSVLDFIEGGAEDEVTIARNRSEFEQLTLIPRVLRDVSAPDLATRILGQPVSLPLLAAPTGLTTMVHPLGEVAVAEAVSRAGTVYLMSGAAGQSPEAVAAATTGARPWFQLYLWRDRGLVRDLLDRADRAGFAALALTVDVPRAGRRERDLRNGFTIPPRITPGTIAQGLARPRWSARFLRSGGLGLGNIDREGTPQPWSVRVNSQTDPSLTWAELEWLRGEWSGPLLVKGVLHPDDAARAVDCGVDGVIVSNHGGRQLDGASSSIAALPGVVEAIGDRAEVLLDGGVRRGTDIAKALALGARACLVGRPMLYGLAAGGVDGAERVIELLRAELETTMALLGCTSIGELTPDLIRSAAAAPRV